MSSSSSRRNTQRNTAASSPHRRRPSSSTASRRNDNAPSSPIGVYEDDDDKADGGNTTTTRPMLPVQQPSTLTQHHSKHPHGKPQLSLRNSNQADNTLRRQQTRFEPPLPNTHSKSPQLVESTSSSSSFCDLQSAWPLTEQLPHICIDSIRLVNTRLIGRGGYSIIMTGNFGSGAAQQQQDDLAIKVFHSPRNSRREFDSLLRSELVAIRLPPSERVIRSLNVAPFVRGGGGGDTKNTAGDDDAKNLYGIVVMPNVCLGNLQQLLSGALSDSGGGHAPFSCVKQLLALFSSCSLSDNNSDNNSEQTATSSYYRVSLDIGLQLAEAADFLHSHCIAHLDIKPSNVMVDFLATTQKSLPRSSTKNCRVLRCRLGDFGSAIDLKSQPSTPTTVHKIALRCTIPYQAPELYLGHLPTTKCDTFSLGIVLWQIMTRNAHVHAFDDKGSPLASHQFIYQIVKYKWRPSLDALNNSGRRSPTEEQRQQHTAPSWLQQLMSNMWHHEPERRCDASQVVSIIDNYMGKR